MASIAFGDVISLPGPNRFLIQDPEGCQQRTVRVGQSVALAGGVVVPAPMLEAAWPNSRMLEDDAALLGYGLVALGAAAGLLVGLGCTIGPSFHARIGGLAALALRGRDASRAEGRRGSAASLFGTAPPIADQSCRSASIGSFRLATIAG